MIPARIIGYLGDYLIGIGYVLKDWAQCSASRWGRPNGFEDNGKSQ